MREARSGAARAVLVATGVGCVGLATVGVVVPVLPTTPFLLLATACFVRSSPRMHRWLLTHPRLGPYVEGFVDGKGVPGHVKRTALFALWPTIALSIALVALRPGSPTLKLLIGAALIVVASLVTRFIARQPTRDRASRTPVGDA